MTRPTYSQITSTLALVVALSAGAYAAGLPRNSVGTPQLKGSAVTTSKVKDKTIKARDLAPGVVPDDGLVVDRGLTPGADVTLGTIGGIRFRATCEEGPTRTTLLVIDGTGHNSLDYDGFTVTNAAPDPVVSTTYAAEVDARTVAATSPGAGIPDRVSVVMQFRLPDQPGLQVLATIRATQGAGTPCDLRLTADPVG